MHVHHLHLRPRNIDERVPLGRHLAQPRAHDNQQVDIVADRVPQLRVGCDRQRPGIMGVIVVEIVLAAERGDDRQ